MKGVFYTMIDIEKLLREGKTMDEIGTLITNELNAAQLKIDEEAKAKRKAEEEKKKAAEAAAQAEKTLRTKREAVIAALTSYISCLFEEEVSEDIIRAGVMEIESSFDMLKNIKVSLNGDKLKSIFDLL